YLPLKPARGKAPVIRERGPKGPLRFGRVTAKKPRESPHRRALRGNATRRVFGKQRSKNFRFLSIKHAPARGPPPAFHECHYNAVQRAHILLREHHAIENVSKIYQHR